MIIEAYGDLLESNMLYLEIQEWTKWSTGFFFEKYLGLVFMGEDEPGHLPLT
jgi:hypothetical protein